MVVIPGLVRSRFFPPRTTDRPEHAPNEDVHIGRHETPAWLILPPVPLIPAAEVDGTPARLHTHHTEHETEALSALIKPHVQQIYTVLRRYSCKGG